MSKSIMKEKDANYTSEMGKAIAQNFIQAKILHLLNNLIMCHYLKNDLSYKLYFKHYKDFNLLKNGIEHDEALKLYDLYSQNKKLSGIEDYDEKLKCFSENNIKTYLEAINFTKEETKTKLINFKLKENHYLNDLIILFNNLQNKLFKYNDSFIKAVKENKSFIDLQKEQHLFSLPHREFDCSTIYYKHEYSIIEEDEVDLTIPFVSIEEDKTTKKDYLKTQFLTFKMPLFKFNISIPLIELNENKSSTNLDYIKNKDDVNGRKLDGTFILKPVYSNGFVFYVFTIEKH